MKSLIGVGGSAADAAEREAALVARLSALAPELHGEPDPAWQESTRARLVAMAAVRRPEPAPVSPLRRLLARSEASRGVWRTRLTVGVAGAAAGVTALAGGVALAADARPGDALYGLKRGTEQTQLALAGDARGSTLLGFASTRIEELSTVLSDEPSVDVVAGTLATMDEQTADGAAWLAERAADSTSSGPLDDLAGWSATQSAMLADLRSELPTAAQDDAADSADLLQRIDDRVDALRTALDCPAGPSTEGADELGPRPAPCPEPPAQVDGGEAVPPAAGGPGTPVTGGGASGGATGHSDTPGSSGSLGTDGPTGSLEPSGSAGAPSPGTGSDPGGLPSPVPSAPVSPGMPSLPPPAPGTPGPPVPDVDVPTLFPDPEGATRPPSGTAGGSSAGGSPPGGSSAGSPSADSPSAGGSEPPSGTPELGGCLPPPVIGSC